MNTQQSYTQEELKDLLEGLVNRMAKVTDCL